MLKPLILSTLFSRWARVPAGGLQDGYTVLLPSPMDMPFLLRYALEGLRTLDTTHCKQILVVPDGWGDDNGAALRQVVQSCGDERVEMVELSWFDYKIIRAMKPPGSAATHWMMVVNGTRRARCKHAFLHDADAFFLEKNGLERQYAECRDRKMHTLGVTPRWDPFFTKLNYEIPGTWELMYSVEWAMAQSPYKLKGRMVNTPHGMTEFDSMLARQYEDYSSNKIGVMKTPPNFVHFNGTIFSYRTFRDRAGKPVTDELFRVLLLALLEELVADTNSPRVVPTVEQLARGLTDDTQDVRYTGAALQANYIKFRHEIEQLAAAPIFAGPRSVRMYALLRPFDEHFKWTPESQVQKVAPVLRTHGVA